MFCYFAGMFGYNFVISKKLLLSLWSSVGRSRMVGTFYVLSAVSMFAKMTSSLRVLLDKTLRGFWEAEAHKTFLNLLFIVKVIPFNFQALCCNLEWR